MECPFCLSDLSPLAIACKACGRDLTGQLYMLRRLEEMHISIGELRESLEVIQSQNTAATAIGPTPPETDGVAEPSCPENHAPMDAAVLRYAVAPAFLLLIAHHFLVFTLDLNPIWLMFVTLVVPVPFGMRAIFVSDRSVLFWGFIFLITASLTIMAMNIDGALSLHDPASAPSILPSTSAEWFQEAEFAAGLYLSFVTGMLSSFLIMHRLRPNHPQLQVTRKGMTIVVGRLRIASSADSVEKIAKYLNSIGAIASAAGAVYLAAGRL